MRLANVTYPAYAAAKRHAGDAIDFRWRDTELYGGSRDNDMRSIKTAAYFLAYLDSQLNTHPKLNSHVSRTRLLRLGYNMGANNMHRVARLDRSPRGDDFTRVLGAFEPAWEVAGDLLRAAGH
jgi:hypothetical protein